MYQVHEGTGQAFAKNELFGYFIWYWLYLRYLNAKLRSVFELGRIKLAFGVFGRLRQIFRFVVFPWVSGLMLGGRIEFRKKSGLGAHTTLHFYKYGLPKTALIASLTLFDTIILGILRKTTPNFWNIYAKRHLTFIFVSKSY